MTTLKTGETGAQSFTIGRYDSLYVPRDASIKIRPGPEGCDLAEVAAPVGRAYPVQFVPFNSLAGMSFWVSRELSHAYVRRLHS